MMIQNTGGLIYEDGFQKQSLGRIKECQSLQFYWKKKSIASKLWEILSEQLFDRTPPTYDCFW